MYTQKSVPIPLYCSHVHLSDEQSVKEEAGYWRLSFVGGKAPQSCLLTANKHHQKNRPCGDISVETLETKVKLTAKYLQHICEGEGQNQELSVQANW